MNGGPLDSTWRRDGGKLVAALARRFRDLDLAEDCLAEAAARAQAAWAPSPPANPSGWLYRTALRCGLDRLRAQGRRPVEDLDALDLEAKNAAETPDERLALYFLCCHPAIGADTQVALILRLAAGLSAEEIARAFLADPVAIYQRLARGKARIAAAGIPFDPPVRAHWPDRMRAVLAALSIIYDQSYGDVAGGVEQEALAREAATLAEALARLTDDPEAHGLAATLCLCESRRPARLDADGAMIPLDEQDVAHWNVALIDAASRHLALAARRRRPGPWQVKALIHAAHARRLSEGETPWRDVAALCDTLARLDPSPVTLLQRALARSRVEGALVALAEIDALNAEGALDRWQSLHAARADLLRRLGRGEDARRAYDEAIARTKGDAERRFLSRRRDSIP